MQDSEKQQKNRPTLMEGCDSVLNLLEEARQTVDKITLTAKGQSGEAKPEKCGMTKAAPPLKFAHGTGKQKTPSFPAASPEAPATVPVPPTPVAQNKPLWDLAHYRILVKHAIAGRIRLHLPMMLYDEALAKRLPVLLTTVPGVISAEASTASGSLLIIFHARELGRAKSRRELAVVMHQFFPGLDTEALVSRMQCG